MTQPIAINDWADVLVFGPPFAIPEPGTAILVVAGRTGLSRRRARGLAHKTGSRSALSRFKSGFRLSYAKFHRNDVGAPAVRMSIPLNDDFEGGEGENCFPEFKSSPI
jgi:hypothetical protein